MANALDAVLAQYEKNTAKTNGGNQSISQEDRLKRYFTTYLPKGTKGGQKTVRILPTSDGSSPFKEVWYHEIQIDGKWTKLYDPGKNDGERSPLTEVYEELTSTGKESDKDLARQYRPRKFYIVKLVDRDNEDHGPKFWRFKDNYKQEGILDKIIPIWKAKGDITDANEGRDLIIELSKAKTPKGIEYTVVQTVMYDDPCTIHKDEAQMKEWVEDELSWQDVYAQKPVEYLEAIARGETPVWSSELKKYVYGDDTELSLGGASNTGKVEESTDPQSKMGVDTDLPF
jgi:hypothetical protein|tara:strand:- start:23540 stop:24397 length:858 start_codon:yes stop_codon:yes gene_type:complete